MAENELTEIDMRSHIIREITEIATEKAIELWQKQEEKQRKEWRSERLKEARGLFKAYMANKIALAEEQEYTEPEKAEMRLQFLEDLMGKPDKGLMRSERQIYNTEHRIAKRMIEIQRVEQAMRMYKREVDLSLKPEQQRRYREVKMMFIDAKPKSVEEIAKIEMIDEKTVYRDIQVAMGIIAEYLYGY